jgi:hypothetical protein
MLNGREPRKHGTEKKDRNVVARIRGFGAVTLVSLSKQQYCAVSGKPTTISLEVPSAGIRISCHSAFIKTGVNRLKTHFRIIGRQQALSM